MSSQTFPQAVPPKDRRLADMTRLVRRLHMTNGIWVGVLWLLSGIVALIFISIIVYLILQGFTYLFNPTFYSLDATNPAAVGAEIFNTFYILILAEIILIPIALAAAIYLTEYARQGPFVTVIHFAAETLAGVPSIVLGLFGAITFAYYAHLGTSRLTGALTLVCLNLPLALRLFEQALSTVPRDLREGGLALGSTKWHMIRTVVLPSALPGLVTGFILSAGKIIGEAAALIFTMGAFNPINVINLNPLIASDTLTVHLWYVLTQGAGTGGLTPKIATTVSAGSAALLILILLIINLGARGAGRLIQRRVTAT
jgi:phosphate transport system permease protein